MARKNSNAAEIVKTSDATLSDDQKPVVKLVGLPDRPHVTSSQIGTEIAKSNVCIRNYSYKGAREAYPFEPDLRVVDRYYPTAAGGPLLIDEPMHDSDVKQCERKALFMKRLGYRYLIIKHASEMFDVMTALDALKDRKGTP